MTSRQNTSASGSPGRRQALGALGSLGLLALYGHACAGRGCVLIPAETTGPFPLFAVLRNPALLRRDIREGKRGVPLTLVLNLRDVRNGCAPVPEAAVYIWHCDKEGQYSGYSGYDAQANGSHRGETFLRGIQLSDSNGQVRFATIYPGWYPGRITHIHVQVYLHDHLRAMASATSQLTFPEEVTATVYRTAPYTRGQNTSVRSIADDDVFRDGAAHQIAAIHGDTVNGYIAVLDVGLRG